MQEPEGVNVNDYIEFWLSIRDRMERRGRRRSDGGLNAPFVLHTCFTRYGRSARVRDENVCRRAG